MNYKLLLLPTTLFACALTLAIACEPCEDDECGVDASGGEGGSDGSGGASGGSSSGGASSGGSASGGDGGIGGGDPTAELDCLGSGTPEGTPGSCEPTVAENDPSYDCQACIQEYCCEEAEACGASDPYTACYYGSTARLDFAGDPIVGEADCILDCMRNIPYEEFIGDQDQVDACALECGSAECNEDEAGAASVALASCMVGITAADPLGCQEACSIVPEP